MIMRQPQQSGAFQVHGISRQETEDVYRRNCIRFCIKLKLGKRHMKYDDEK